MFNVSEGAMVTARLPIPVFVQGQFRFSVHTCSVIFSASGISTDVLKGWETSVPTGVAAAFPRERASNSIAFDFIEL